MERTDRKPRQAQEATVTGRTELSPDMVRLSLNAPGLRGRDLAFTDHYVKLLFAPAGADYSWPFDVAELRETREPAERPVTRTYTFRRVDTATGDFDLDFVLHGDEGLAGPWARNAQVGDTLGFLGPGGAWRPEEGYEHFVLAGDEAAAPAIAAAIEHLPAGTTAEVYVEIAAEGHEFDMPRREGVTLTWVPRSGATEGTELSRVVRAAGYPEKRTSWFIHGVAEMIKELRRFLFVDGEIERADASISGYWRLGMTEDGWQASKRDFVAEMEREEQTS
ncbi:siderophore-interacting protein [Corynebacterium doosanense]|uniref:FAD-binding protein n=1 Tax=Corynebacterium doosanense CAU 212 = DSM 45436 TaxID=558173 RepID=A0A097IFI5_9CORY|nr:siderophore-interacting protein [Corynebacterium doosanense]AIT60889.1 FAD-binding protein [Corynebacterium doosanense CAU 212 = DSM 45436]